MRNIFTLLCLFFALSYANAAPFVRIKFLNVSEPCNPDGYEVVYRSTSLSGNTTMISEGNDWYYIDLLSTPSSDLELDIYFKKVGGSTEFLATHNNGITFTNNEICLIYDAKATQNWTSFICTPPSTPTITGFATVISQGPGNFVCNCDKSAVLKVNSPVPGVTYAWSTTYSHCTLFPIIGDTTTLSFAPTAIDKDPITVTVTSSNAYKSTNYTIPMLRVLDPPATPTTITNQIGATITSSDIACTPGVPKLSYTVTSVARADTYRWSIPSDWINTSTVLNSSKLEVTSGTMSGEISVAAGILAIKCYSAPKTFTIIASKPATPVGPISGSSNVCKNTAGLTYSVPNNPPPVGSTYQWFVKGAGWSITNGANTNTVTVTSGTENGLVYLKQTNTCGNGYGDSISFDVNVYSDLSVNFNIPATGDIGMPITFNATASDCQGTPSFTFYVKLPNQPHFQEITAPASPYTPTMTGTYTFKVVATDGSTTREEEKQVVVVDPLTSAITVKVKEYSGWGINNYYLYCWNWLGTFSFDSNNPPQMTLETICGENWYSYTFPSTLTETDMFFRNRNDCNWYLPEQSTDINGSDRVKKSTCYGLSVGATKAEYSIIPCPEPFVDLSAPDGIVGEEVCITATTCPDFFNGNYNTTFYIKHESEQNYTSLGNNHCFTPTEEGTYSIFVSVEQNNISASAETTINIIKPHVIRIKQPGKEWGDNIHIYTHTPENFGSWPGMKLVNPICDDWYEVSFETISDMGYVEFNNGDDESFDTGKGLIGTNFACYTITTYDATPVTCTPCPTTETVSTVVANDINIFYNSGINILSEEIMREVIIFNVQGQTVYANKVNSTSLNISNLPQGIYIIRVITANNNYTSKIIVW